MKGIKGRVEALRSVKASKEVKILLVPVFDLFTRPWGLVNSFFSPIKLARRLL